MDGMFTLITDEGVNTYEYDEHIWYMKYTKITKSQPDSGEEKQKQRNNIKFHVKTNFIHRKVMKKNLNFFCALLKNLLKPSRILSTAADGFIWALCSPHDIWNEIGIHQNWIVCIFSSSSFLQRFFLGAALLLELLSKQWDNNNKFIRVSRALLSTTMMAKESFPVALEVSSYNTWSIWIGPSRPILCCCLLLLLFRSTPTKNIWNDNWKHFTHRNVWKHNVMNNLK